MSIFCSNISYFFLGYSITPFEFYFLSDLAGCVFTVQMRFGSSLSIECFKNTVIKTQLLIPVFAGQAEATRDSLW